MRRVWASVKLGQNGWLCGTERGTVNVEHRSELECDLRYECRSQVQPIRKWARILNHESCLLIYYLFSVIFM